MAFNSGDIQLFSACVESGILGLYFFGNKHNCKQVYKDGISLCALLNNHSFYRPQELRPFENIIGKEENAGNQQFLLFPQCFLPSPNQIPVFHLQLLCRLQMLLI